MNCSLFEDIRRLRVCARVKAELVILATRARTLVVRMLNFIRRNSRFCEAILLGSLVAYLLAHVPLIGGLLALCALVTAAAWGLMKQMEADISALFASEITA